MLHPAAAASRSRPHSSSFFTGSASGAMHSAGVVPVSSYSHFSGSATLRIAFSSPQRSSSWRPITLYQPARHVRKGRGGKGDARGRSGSGRSSTWRRRCRAASSSTPRSRCARPGSSPSICCVSALVSHFSRESRRAAYPRLKDWPPLFGFWRASSNKQTSYVYLCHNLFSTDTQICETRERGRRTRRCPFRCRAPGASSTRPPRRTSPRRTSHAAPPPHRAARRASPVGRAGRPRVPGVPSSPLHPHVYISHRAREEDMSGG